MSKREGGSRSHFPWLSRREAEAYKDSQQSGRPRQGVTWFATDIVGHIAAFDSDVAGYVPMCVFENSLKQHLALYEHFIRPVVDELTGDSQDDLPKLGLYYFAIVNYGATDGYDRLAVPSVPLTASSAPVGILPLVAKVVFDGRFCEADGLFAAKHWKCI
jgi:hypothetical protein